MYFSASCGRPRLRDAIAMTGVGQTEVRVQIDGLRKVLLRFVILAAR